MNKIIVTGATSFIGKKLVEKLSIYNEVYAIIRPNSNGKKYIENKENIKILEIDMDRYSDIENINHIKDIDCCIHLAWNGTRMPDRDNEELQRKNYLNSIELFKSLKETGCKKIVGIGSQAEYGNYNGLICEDIDTNPNTPYGKYKLTTFKSGMDIFDNDKFKFLWIRIFSLYGVGDYKNTLVMSCIRKMLKNEDIAMTECKHLWNYLNISDAVDAIISIAKSSINSGAYNVASLKSKELREYICEIKKITNSNSKLLFGKLPYGVNGAVNLNPSIEKILASGIDWKEKISFESGILEIIKDMES